MRLLHLFLTHTHDCQELGVALVGDFKLFSQCLLVICSGFPCHHSIFSVQNKIELVRKAPIRHPFPCSLSRFFLHMNDQSSLAHVRTSKQHPQGTVQCQLPSDSGTHKQDGTSKGTPNYPRHLALACTPSHSLCSTASSEICAGMETLLSACLRASFSSSKAWVPILQDG